MILFRQELDLEKEEAIASSYMPTCHFRTQVPNDTLVVGRYSVLPYYRELELELALQGSRLINSFRQHQYIADVMEWGSEYGCLHGLTPKTWDNWAHLPEGAYVVKGRTNSRKQQWLTKMFAPTKGAVPLIASKLLDDPLIADQGIVVREYIPLKKLAEGLNGLPISNEWRTFWITTPDGPRMLCKGFYWASHEELLETGEAAWSDQAEAICSMAAERVSQHANFFVLDMAETATGEWIVIEVNDGQMSGLSCCDPHELYRNLSRFLGPK